MNSKIMALKVYIVLISGLVSCSPDKTNNHTLDVNPVTVEIKNRDSTYQKIKDTKQLSINSFIDLSLNKIPLTETLTTTQVDCRSSFIKEPLMRESALRGMNEISVKNILPIEVFTPHSNLKSEIHCDFYIESFQNDKKLMITRIKDVEITDISEFKNFDIPIFNAESKKRANKADLVDQTLVLPVDDGEIQTLCEKSRLYNFIKSNPVTFNDLFEDSLFIKNIEHCRFIVTNKKDQEIWVSTDFYIQRKKPDLEFLGYENLFETKEVNDLSQKPLARIQFRNVSGLKNYFTLSDLETQIHILPLYFAPQRGYEMGNLGQAFLISAQWQLVNPIPTKEAHSLEETIFEVMPNERLTLELISNQSITCVTNKSNFSTYDSAQALNCNMHILLSGMIFKINNFPIIGLNLFSDLSSLEIHRFLSFQQPQVFYDQFNFWSPYRDVNQLCAQRVVEKMISQTPVRMDLKNPQEYNCRAH